MEFFYLITINEKYYKECRGNQFVQTASAQIIWSHNILILDKIKSDLCQRQVLNGKQNNFETE